MGRMGGSHTCTDVVIDIYDLLVYQHYWYSQPRLYVFDLQMYYYPIMWHCDTWFVQFTLQRIRIFNTMICIFTYIGVRRVTVMILSSLHALNIELFEYSNSVFMCVSVCVCVCVCVCVFNVFADYRRARHTSVPCDRHSPVAKRIINRWLFIFEYYYSTSTYYIYSTSTWHTILFEYIYVYCCTMYSEFSNIRRFRIVYSHHSWKWKNMLQFIQILLRFLRVILFQRIIMLSPPQPPQTIMITSWHRKNLMSILRATE